MDILIVWSPGEGRLTLDTHTVQLQESEQKESRCFRLH